MRFALRIGGTNEFVSKIDADDPCCSRPGSIETVKGWDHENILFFDDACSALAAEDVVANIEGCSCSIEKFEDR